MVALSKAVSLNTALRGAGAAALVIFLDDVAKSSRMVMAGHRLPARSSVASPGVISRLRVVILLRRLLAGIVRLHGP